MRLTFSHEAVKQFVGGGTPLKETAEPFRAVKDRKQYHERSQLKKSVIRKAIALILTLVAQKALDNPACFNTALAVCLDLIALSTTNLRCV